MGNLEDHNGPGALNPQFWTARTATVEPPIVFEIDIRVNAILGILIKNACVNVEFKVGLHHSRMVDCFKVTSV